MIVNASAEHDPPPHRWRSPLLGTPVELELPHGRVQGFRRGAGPVVVLAHGWLANANLWRFVVEALADRFLCVTLDLPFGAHRVAVRADADLTPLGCGRLIADALAALDLTDVTLVGNDSGGAYSQIAVSRWPERVGRLVLTSCETPYDAFPPPPFDGLPAAARDPAMLGQLFGALRDRSVRRSPLAYGLLHGEAIDERASDSYALPCLEDAAVLRDASKVMASAASAPVHEAGRRLIEQWTRPVGFVWSPDDPVFPFAHAERYAAALQCGRLVRIGGPYSFTPEEQPGPLAAAIAAFGGGASDGR